MTREDIVAACRAVYPPVTQHLAVEAVRREQYDAADETACAIHDRRMAAAIIAKREATVFDLDGGGWGNLRGAALNVAHYARHGGGCGRAPRLDELRVHARVAESLEGRAAEGARHLAAAVLAGCEAGLLDDSAVYVTCSAIVQIALHTRKAGVAALFEAARAAEPEPAAEGGQI